MSSAKTSRQLLFSEVVAQYHPIAAPETSPAMDHYTVPSCMTQESTMVHILQEVTAVSRQLEGMNTDHTDIASFQDRVKGVEQRLADVEDCLNTILDKEQEHLKLEEKLTDLEDRSCRDNVHIFGFPEYAEEADVKDFLKGLLPSLVGLTFSPLLEL
ncbi:hypothetical protein NDU88_000511 [Pleurodeles waltl]|uniref:Uncharacterized protein n=1 Tax=Pleurodeles waltl TaxID=8319 RepID=A0AAV7P4D5_PLEWA|nr:hypothetical protein NDU88_000511 [Pleurodeles waltl]